MCFVEVKIMKFCRILLIVGFKRRIVEVRLEDVFFVGVYGGEVLFNVRSVGFKLDLKLGDVVRF